MHRTSKLLDSAWHYYYKAWSQWATYSVEFQWRRVWSLRPIRHSQVSTKKLPRHLCDVIEHSRAPNALISTSYAAESGLQPLSRKLFTVRNVFSIVQPSKVWFVVPDTYSSFHSFQKPVFWSIYQLICLPNSGFPLKYGKFASSTQSSNWLVAYECSPIIRLGPVSRVVC